MCGSLPSAVRVFVFQVLTVKSNSWTTPLVLCLPSSGNVSERYCWNGSMLIASGSLSDWSVTVDRPWGGPWCYYNKLSSARACLLSDRAGLLTRFLTVQAGLLTRSLTLTVFKSGRPVYNPVERLTNGSTVNNIHVCVLPLLWRNSCCSSCYERVLNVHLILNPPRIGYQFKAS